MIAPASPPPERASKAGPYVLTLLLAILIALGLFQHVWAQRPEKANDPAEITARLARIPLRIGSWEGQDETENLPAYPPGKVGPIRTIRYVNRQSGEAVSILVTAGPTGPMLFNHQPTNCYTAVGYELVSGPIRHTVSSATSSADFLVGQFTKTAGATPSSLRIFWSFSAAGAWQVPASPRLAFARYPVLFKVYVTRPLHKRVDPVEKDPANEFIRELVPELDKAALCRPARPGRAEVSSRAPAADPATSRRKVAGAAFHRPVSQPRFSPRDEARSTTTRCTL